MIFAYNFGLQKQIPMRFCTLWSYTFKCINCPMTFGSKHYLTQHTSNSHLHRPFKCKETGCSKDFGTKRYLNVHMAVVHLANKTYKCNCERIFGSKSELEIHQRSAGHGKEKLVCHFANCTAAFASTSKLSRHKKTVHLKEKHLWYSLDIHNDWIVMVPVHLILVQKFKSVSERRKISELRVI